MLEAENVYLAAGALDDIAAAKKETYTQAVTKAEALEAELLTSKGTDADFPGTLATTIASYLKDRDDYKLIYDSFVALSVAADATY